jgi:beta-lactam-binding protein with PASTA domain
VPSRQERSTTNPDEDGQVIDQRPGAGAEVEEGRAVVIVVGALIQDEELNPPAEEPPPPESTP